MKKIYTINTNEANVFLDVIYNPFLKKFKEDNSNIELHNIIDDSLLNDTRRYDGMTSTIATRMLYYAKAAEASGADGILVTCTSVNKATKYIRPLLTVPILNIEEPVAEMSVAHGQRIGVLGTIPTSPSAISSVIQEKADESGKKIEIISMVADGAFDVLKQGDRKKHDEIVVAKLKELASKVDVVAFAQISMSLIPVDGIDVPVYKIGNSGLEKIKELINA